MPNSLPIAPLPPTLLLALCIVAGLGTILLLPNPNRDAMWRRIGGGLLILCGVGFGVTLLAWSAAYFQFSDLFFYAFGGLAVFCAARVVTHPQPVYASLYFVLSVFASAGLFVLLQSEFLATALVVIYAGAILVTYVFVIMLAAEASGSDQVSQIAGAKQFIAEHDATSREPLAAAIVGFATMGILLFVIMRSPTAIASHGPIGGEITSATNLTPHTVNVQGEVQRLGVYLFTRQLVSLELAGLILTLAMVGAIVIARKRVFAVGDIELPQPPKPGEAWNIPVDDNPHSIPIAGTLAPEQKAYPET